MLVPISALVALIVVAPSLLLTLRGRPTPFRDARARLIARNPMLGDAQLIWRVNYVSHRRSNRTVRATQTVRATVTRLIVTTTLLYVTYCGRRPTTADSVRYGR